MTEELRAQFFIEQFRELRKEIEAAKERAFRVYGVGILVVPALSQLIQNLGSNETLTAGIGLVFPFFVLTVMLLFQAENRSIKRCGSYIKDNIENNMNDDVFRGWETWLSEIKHPDPQYAAKSFYFIFLLYYYATSITATVSLHSMLEGMGNAPVMWGASLFAGLIYLLFGMAVQCSFYHSVFYQYKEDSECPLYNFLFNRFLKFLPKTDKEEESCV